MTISDVRWQRKHFETLRQNYGRAPHYRDLEAFLEHVYLGRSWQTLSSLNQFLVKSICRDFLGIETRFDDSGNYSLSGSGQTRLLELLAVAGATTYVSGPSGRSYIDVGEFEKRGIHVIFKDYSGYAEYSQFHPPFEHRVSILDLLFHTGPDAGKFIWGER